MKKLRWIYAAAFALLLAAEIVIAVFVRDSFVRPYGGDVLAVCVLFCLARIVFPRGYRLLPLWVFVFACGAELVQALNLPAVFPALQHPVLRVLLGQTFDPADLVCYAVGCAACAASDALIIKLLGGRNGFQHHHSGL